MSEIPSASQPGTTNPDSVARPAVAPADIDASCRLPLVVLFLCAAVWLVIGSAFTLIASLKFHAPGFLADSAWLTYGRVRPAGFNCILYGFCVQAGLGVALWLLARLGRTKLALPGLVTAGAMCWNLGVAAGVAGILAGGSTGFENLEMPRYAATAGVSGLPDDRLVGRAHFPSRRERQTLCLAVVPVRRAVLVPVDLFDGQPAAAHLQGAGHGAGGNRLVVFRQPAGGLARIGWPGGGLLFRAQAHQPRPAQPLSRAAGVLDADPLRELGRHPGERAGAGVDARVERGGHGSWASSRSSPWP